MALGLVKQQNIAFNKARNLIFFEGTELCYNFKTQQWTDCPAYLDLGFYSFSSKAVSIGLIRYSSGSVSITAGSTSAVAQTATITTGAIDPNEGGRAVITGVRPIANGGTYAVRVGIQDDIDAAVTWSASTSVNTRSNMANFRSEGRYVRVETVITGGFTTVMGADVDFSPQGFV